MRKKHSKREHRNSSGFDQLSAHADFYAGGPTERPLYQDRQVSDLNRVHKTARHQAVAGRRKETMDPREKRAFLAILRAIIVILVLVIAFVMLWKGIRLYEERIFMEKQPLPELSPVMQEILPDAGFDIEATGSSVSFAERVKIWQDSERMLRSVEELIVRNNHDQALMRCQEILRIDPAHKGALECLGQLYFAKGMFAEAINTYIRLLSADPSRADHQLALMKALDAYGDSEATIHVAEWYQEQNTYNRDVQHYLANAYYRLERFGEAATAYERVAKDFPKNTAVLNNLANSYMQLGQYDPALAALNKLVDLNLRDPACYKQIAVCNAQLGRPAETVQVLGKSAHLFGPDIVILWLQDPRMDPVRMDRDFQSFTDRIGGEDFRKYLERMAQTLEKEPDKTIVPQLDRPEPQTIDMEILKPKQ